MERQRDDSKYIKLMDRYKVTRIDNPEGALKYLEAASKLRSMGKVSDDAVLAAAYL